MRQSFISSMESALFKRSMVAGAFLAAFPSFAHAIDVYPGCSIPTLKPGHHTFYVDPIRGSDQGDGSAQKPWKDLSDVIGIYNKLISSKAWSNKTQSYADVNLKAPVKGGDVIMLMSGNYGTQKILNVFNNDFIWVMAAPGQTPVISQLQVVSSAKWVFQGIKFQGGTPSLVTDINKKAQDRMVSVGWGDYTGVSNNILFDSDTFSTTDDVTSWSDRDWILKPYMTAFSSRATCVSLTNSKIYNVFDGVMLGMDHNLMQSNTVDSFANDGADLTHGYTTLRGNTFTNGKNSKLDGMHADGIQGWSDFVKVNGVTAPSTNVNVLIENNEILKSGTDPLVSYLQGISIFDGKWDNLVIQNNVVVTNTRNGITVFGAKNSKIINNTVATSNSEQPLLWIYHDKYGNAPQNLIVRNNIAPTIAVAERGVIFDHNIFTSKLIGMEGSKIVTFVKTGQPSTRSILVSLTSSLFAKLDPQNGVYDLRLKAGSSAIGAGTTANAPTYDITGKQRKTPVDLGAYGK